MDIALAQTFLEIVETGSFVAAAKKLNITQTAVSARIKKIEQKIGKRLFVRNKSGARLTDAGERFVRHATMLIQTWDSARRQLALPETTTQIARVGAEISLWNPIMVKWIKWIRNKEPGIAVRADVGTSGRLLQAVHDGGLDMAVLYDPPAQGATTVVELLHDEKLVMVTTEAASDAAPIKDYIHIDWGPSFNASLQAAYPELGSPGISMTHGPLGLLYLLQAGGTGYFRLGAVRRHLEAGLVRRVERAPEFSYSMYMVYSSRTDPELIDAMRRGFMDSV